MKKDEKLTTIYGTENSQFLITGKKYEVSKSLAETLIKKGQATKTLKK